MAQFIDTLKHDTTLKVWINDKLAHQYWKKWMPMIDLWNSQDGIHKFGDACTIEVFAIEKHVNNTYNS